MVFNDSHLGFSKERGGVSFWRHSAFILSHALTHCKIIFLFASVFCEYFPGFLCLNDSKTGKFSKNQNSSCLPITEEYGVFIFRAEKGELEVDETNPIDIWTVANVASVIYNQSGLGFAKERNGVNW